MCDTILATPTATRARVMLFGKNSDRQCNESQTVEFFPARDHARSAPLRCTYIDIPQVSHTFATVLCRPFWIWGAEMGANEHGVVIGNEGLQARSPPPRDNALIGMDLLRLALERAATASEAVEVITGLLERHGHGGDCGHLTPNFYNNGFIVADAQDAFALETVGREWLVERLRDVRAMSNEYSIAQPPERTSAGLDTMLRGFGWDPAKVSSPADVIKDPHRAHIGSAGARRRRATHLLEADRDRLEIGDVLRILRDHDPDRAAGPAWTPRDSVKYSLCIHAGADSRLAQTTGALASEIRAVDSVHWVTGTSAPCLSIFKPVLLGTPLPDHGPRPTDRFDAATLWWRHERLHRTALLGDFAGFLDSIRSERDELEAEFRRRIQVVLSGGSPADRARVVNDCWREAARMEDAWYGRLRAMNPPGGHTREHQATLAKMSALAGLDPGTD